MKNKKKGLPNLTFQMLFFLSFGIFGAQMSQGLESSQLGRLFQTLGASPKLLAIIFLIPPFAGLIIQPIVGKYSDETWIPKIGRRMPYLIGGTLLSMIALFILPNCGNWGLSLNSVLIIGSSIVFLYMIASNICMAPYKTWIGDMINEDQKGKASSIQSILTNAGTVCAAIAPWVLTKIGVSNTASKGVIPDTVKYSFYIAAIVLAFCTIITVMKVHEYSPKEFNEFHGVDNNEIKIKKGILQLLKDAPKSFWTVALVQFFGFITFGLLWTYGSGAVAKNVYNAIDPTSAAYQMGGNLFGILSAIYALSAAIVSVALSKIPRKHYIKAFFSTMLIGTIGFILFFFSHSEILMIIDFILIGVGWAGILVYPIAFVTDDLPAQYMGIYLGLFNAQICIPQIVASILSVGLVPLVNDSLPAIILIGGIIYGFATFSTLIVKNKK